MEEALFDGYAQDYDEWFVANEKVFLSELGLLETSLGIIPAGHYRLAAAAGCLSRPCASKPALRSVKGLNLPKIWRPLGLSGG